jgi:hypothetical protein
VLLAADGPEAGADAPGHDDGVLHVSEELDLESSDRPQHSDWTGKSEEPYPLCASGDFGDRKLSFSSPSEIPPNGTSCLGTSVDQVGEG